MSQKIFAALVGIIAATGYAGVLVLMAIQSACIPIPSEVIMPVPPVTRWLTGASCN